MTIEPGFYEDGEFGIRIENCNLVVNAETRYCYAKNVQFVRFEPLTWVPIQREFIDKSLMNQEEIQWINDYHRKCVELVGNELKRDNKIDVYEWLIEQAQSI